MEEKVTKVNESVSAIEQPDFEVRNFRENRPTYAISGALVWKKKPKRARTYPTVKTESVRIREGGFIVREDVLGKSKELYERLHELIPVGLDSKNTLINGYEQYLLAVEMGLKNITYVPVKISKTEQRIRRKRNVERERNQRYNARKARQHKKSQKDSQNKGKSPT